jgi:hypothetical protein
MTWFAAGSAVAFPFLSGMAILRRWIKGGNA